MVENEYFKPKPMLPLLLVLLVVACLGVWVCDRGPIEDYIREGKPGPQYQLGKCYYYGIGVPANSVEAAKWFRLAAAHGNARAQTALAILYIHGDGVIRNHGAAVTLLRRAADQGLDLAQNQLGMLYAQGMGVPQNFEEAAKWFAKAASQGYQPASHNLKLIAALRPPSMPSLTLKTGKTLYAVKVQSVEPDSITICFQPRAGGLGMAKLAFKDLPDELQTKYGYQPGLAVQIPAFDQLAVITVRTL